MSTIITMAAAAPLRMPPIMAAFISSLPGSIQRAVEDTPAQKAAYTSHFAIGEA
jgi:hypothetical protein